LEINKDVFLGACKLMRELLGEREAALQVVGISMGGVIGRYGLAWAEDIRQHPGQHIEHYVNTFISFDSPQQGAHVNNGLQDFIKRQDELGRADPDQVKTLQAIAAQQMLYYDPYRPTRENTFYGRLRQLNNREPSGDGYTNGYPRLSKNFSVSNGTRTSNYPPDQFGNRILAEFRLYLYSQFSVNFYGLFFTPLTLVQPIERTIIPAEERDLWPGSTFTFDLTKIASSAGIVPWGGAIPLGRSVITGGTSYIFKVNFNPGYIPTESALDLDENTYTRASDGSLSGGKSWFDGTLIQHTFKRHEELTEDSKTQVMNWLNANRTYPYLGRPSNLSAIQHSSDQVKIVFDGKAAIFEEGFKVERKQGDGNFVEVTTLPPNSSEFIDGGLIAGTTYTYRVRSFSGNRFSAYSPELSFTMPLTPLTAPTLVFPADGTDKLGEGGGPTLSVTLNWNEVPSATSYHVQVARDQNFKDLVFDQSNITGLLTTISGLAYRTGYNWRVEALGNGLRSPWSEQWWFITRGRRVIVKPDIAARIITADTSHYEGEAQFDWEAG
jgi:hypothetical protein